MNLFGSLHLAVERQGSDAIGTEVFGNLACATCARYVDDGGAVMAEDEVAQLLIFIVISIGMDDAVAEVLALRVGSKYLES